MTEQKYGQVISAYETLMKEFWGKSLFGLVVDESPQLKALCLLCAERCTNPEEAATIISGFLSDAWLLNVVMAKELGEFAYDPVFPVDYGQREVQMWAKATMVGKRLSTMLEQRIGICPSYAFALAIVVKVAGLAEKVFLASYEEAGVGHMLVLTEEPDTAIDLGRRAHFGNNSLPKILGLYNKLEL